MPNLGAVALGAMAGVGIGIVGAIPFLASGADTADVGGQSALILLGMASQFVAGFVAARIARRDDETHGGLAGLAAFGIVGVIALAAGENPSIATLSIGAITSLVLGSLGGFLSRSRRS